MGKMYPIMSSSGKDLVSNRKAYHSYEILETFEAGIALVGTEVKSLRDNQGSLLEAYVSIFEGEAFLINASIPPYRFGNIHNHEEKRKRKLLLHKSEIEQLQAAIDRQGLTVIPISIYLKKGLIKVKIAIGRGKKMHDKRAHIKERDVKREMDRVMKEKR